MQCRFAKEAELSLPSTFHVYKLSHDMLDLIKGERLWKTLKLPNGIPAKQHNEIGNHSE